MSEHDDPRRLPPLPPLRVHHFMLASIAVAAVMSLYSALMQSRDSAPALYFVYVLGGAIPQTLAATTLALGIYWQQRGAGPFFVEPGHWLLLAPTLDLLLGVAGPLYFRLAAPDLGDAARYFVALLYVLPRVAAGVAFIIAPRYIIHGERWAPLFITFGLLRVLLALVSYLPVSVPFAEQFRLDSVGSFVFHMTIWAGLIWLLDVGVAADRRLGVKRHWSHWCGVATWLCVPIIYVLQRLTVILR